MNKIITQLNILMDGLRKKERHLLEIVNITENQGTVLESELPDAEALEFIKHMNIEKQGHIESVIGCDSLFESVLKEIGGALDANPTAYRPQVKALQDGIKRVMDLDVRVRVCEERNNQLILLRRGPEPQKPGRIPMPANTEKLIRAYKSNTRS